MPSGKKRKRHKVATKSKSPQEEIVLGKTLKTFTKVH